VHFSTGHRRAYTKLTPIAFRVRRRSAVGPSYERIFSFLLFYGTVRLYHSAISGIRDAMPKDLKVVTAAVQ